MRLLLILSSFISVMAFARSPEIKNAAFKVIHIRINDAGMISDGLDTLSIDDLALYIRERLFKNYSGTGKMYDKIKIDKHGENVSPIVIDIVVKEIKAGQKAALAELCLHKYKKGYDELASKQQEKVKKQFPVLFQMEFL